MKIMYGFKKLLEQCKCDVTLTINDHRHWYQSVEEYLTEKINRDCPPQIESEIRQKMIDTDTIVCCHFYPDTPIGSYEVYHYDLDKCLEECLACLGIGT